MSGRPKEIAGSRSFCDDLNVVTVVKDISSRDIVCGVYAIYNADNGMVYIGSSVNCYKRMRSHYSRLKNGKHYNAKMQEDFLKHSRFYYYIIEECQEEHLLTEENNNIEKYCSSIYNRWSNSKLEEIKPFLDKCIKKDMFQEFDISENGCWNFRGKKNRAGYGATKTGINGVYKNLIAHRVMYYKETGLYPHLLRHKCNNRACVNPKHLEEGSYSDNAKDTYRAFRKEFEEIWLKYKGDRTKITSHFGWKITHTTKNGEKYSRQVASMENKLGLVKKYPQILRQPKSIGSRGPRKKKIEGTIKGRWKCIESHVQPDKHIWECEKCGMHKFSKTNNINRKGSKCNC